jgi:Mor family transcriptional regulator
MNSKTFYIPVGTKKYPLIVSETGRFDPNDGEIIHIHCDILNLNQDYLKSDLPLLFMDIAEMIEGEIEQKAIATIHIRLKPTEKLLIEKQAQKQGYTSLTDFVKAKCIH